MLYANTGLELPSPPKVAAAMSSSFVVSIVAGLLACTAYLPGAHAGGSIEGRVVIEPMKSATGPDYRVQTKNPVQSPDPQLAILYLESDDGRYPKARTDQVIHISQRGYQFRPAVRAVQTGSRVIFP